MEGWEISLLIAVILLLISLVVYFYYKSRNNVPATYYGVQQYPPPLPQSPVGVASAPLPTQASMQAAVLPSTIAPAVPQTVISLTTAPPVTTAPPLVTTAPPLPPNVSTLTWTNVPNITADFVSASSQNDVWALQGFNGGNIYHMENGAWVQKPGKLAKISAGYSGGIWGINAGGLIYQWVNNGWTARPGWASWVTSGLYTIVIGSTGGMFLWDRGSQQWKAITGNAAPITQVTCSDSGDMWVISGGLVYRMTLNGYAANFTQIPNPTGSTMLQVESGLDGVVAVDTNQKLWHFNGSIFVPLNGTLTQIASGANIWGVDGANNVFKSS